MNIRAFLKSFYLLLINKITLFKILTETVAARARVTLIVCVLYLFLVSLYSSPFLGVVSRSQFYEISFFLVDFLREMAFVEPVR